MKKPGTLLIALLLASFVAGCSGNVSPEVDGAEMGGQGKATSIENEENSLTEESTSIKNEEDSLTEESAINSNTSIEGKIEYYLGLTVDQEWKLVEPEENPENLDTGQNAYLFVKDESEEIIYYSEDAEGNLISVYTTAQIGALADNSEEKQKEAALQYILEKGFEENADNIVFDRAEKQKYFTNYCFQGKFYYMIGVSDRNTKVVSVFIDY